MLSWHFGVSSKSHLRLTFGPPYSYVGLNSCLGFPRIYALRVRAQLDDTNEPLCIIFLVSKCPRKPLMPQHLMPMANSWNVRSEALSIARRTTAQGARALELMPWALVLAVPMQHLPSASQSVLSCAK